MRFNGFFEDSYGTLIKDELSFLMNFTVKPVSKLRRNQIVLLILVFMNPLQFLSRLLTQFQFSKVTDPLAFVMTANQPQIKFDLVANILLPKRKTFQGKSFINSFVPRIPALSSQLRAVPADIYIFKVDNLNQWNRQTVISIVE